MHVPNFCEIFFIRLDTVTVTKLYSLKNGTGDLPSSFLNLTLLKELDCQQRDGFIVSGETER